MRIEQEESESYVEPARAGSILRPILMIAVLVMGSYILADWRDEIDYFLSPSEPIEVGSVTEFAAMSEEPDWRAPLEHNRYVELSGIAIRGASSSRYTYAQLLGGPVYLETKLDPRRAEQLAAGGAPTSRHDPRADADRAFFAGRGRALSLEALPESYQTLREFYGKAYNTKFCSDLGPQERARLERERRAIEESVWRALPQNEGEEPSAAEIDQRVAASGPLCRRAWLIQAEYAPKDAWHYIVLSALFALFMLLDLFFLVRWIVRFLRPDDIDP